MNSEIADNLKKQMQKKGVNSLELARQSDVKPSFIYDILHGKSANPSTIRLSRVARSLGVDLNHLIDSEENFSKSLSDIRFESGGQENIKIPVLGAKTSGGKTRVLQDDSISPGFFHVKWLENSLGINAENVRIVFCEDDAMSPTLNQGDMAIIDYSNGDISNAGIFAIYNGVSVILRRIEQLVTKKDNMLKIISDNENYGHNLIQHDEVDVLGRVVYIAKKI